MYLTYNGWLVEKDFSSMRIFFEVLYLLHFSIKCSYIGQIITKKQNKQTFSLNVNAQLLLMKVIFEDSNFI